MCVIFVVLSPLSTAFAQTTDNRQVIAVNVDSSEPRIQQMLPRLRDQAVKVVEDSAKNVQAIPIIGSAATPEEEARRISADYLLTINLTIAHSVESPSWAAPGTGPTTTADVPTGRVPYGIAHSRCADLLGDFTYSYTLLSLTGKLIKLHDSHTLRESEYPLGPDLECLDKLSTRAVRNDASSAIHKLKSKKGL